MIASITIRFWIFYIISVSYTHLDVYKRQSRMNLTESCSCFRNIVIVPFEGLNLIALSKRFIQICIKSPSFPVYLTCLLYTSYTWKNERKQGVFFIFRKTIPYRFQRYRFRRCRSFQREELQHSGLKMHAEIPSKSHFLAYLFMRFLV